MTTSSYTSGSPTEGSSETASTTTAPSGGTSSLGKRLSTSPTGQLALDRERELIRAFRPPFNRQHNVDHVEARKGYLAFKAAVQAESFIDQYRRINARLPLRVINQTADELTMISGLSEREVGRTIADGVGAPVYDLRRKVGSVAEIRTVGAHSVISARLKMSLPPQRVAVARIAAPSSLQKPIVVRVKTVLLDETGFTLVELLVVLIILGLLSGILLFAVGEFQTNAGRARDTANERTCYTAKTAARAFWNNEAQYGRYLKDGAAC